MVANADAQQGADIVGEFAALLLVSHLRSFICLLAVIL